jgi:hypothetical protein
LKQISSKDGRSESNVSAWAFGIAVGIHIVALFILAAVTLAKAQDRSDENSATTIGQIKSLSETPAITPKPKVKEAPLLVQAATNEKTWRLPSLAQEYRTSIRNDQADLTTLAAKTSVEKPMLTAAAAQTGRIEFFGSPSYDHEVCFVVDSSGSMSGVLESQVIKQLKKTIDSLDAQQHFSVIFFGGSGLHEYSRGKMVNASTPAKEAVYKFAKSIKPSGKAGALPALKRAMEVRDSRGNKPAIIYFLTDGFELDSAAGKTFCKEVARLRQTLTPKTKINTIGFWAQKSDRAVLETIAAESGGMCVFINKE